MKALITGATGFVGSWLVHTAPCEVLTTGREFDLSGDWDLVIHAGHVTFEADNIRNAYEVYTASKARGAHSVFISSGAARFADDTYGKTKMACEPLFDLSLRLYSFIGPRLRSYAPAKMMQRAALGGDVEIEGNGLTIRSYLYAEDMANLIWRYAFERGVIEIGSSVPVTMLQLAHTIARHYGVGVKTLGGSNGLRPVYLPIRGQMPRDLEEQVALTARSMGACLHEKGLPPCPSMR